MAEAAERLLQGLPDSGFVGRSSRSPVSPRWPISSLRTTSPQRIPSSADPAPRQRMAQQTRPSALRASGNDSADPHPMNGSEPARCSEGFVAPSDSVPTRRVCELGSWPLGPRRPIRSRQPSSHYRWLRGATCRSGPCANLERGCCSGGPRQGVRPAAFAAAANRRHLRCPNSMSAQSPIAPRAPHRPRRHFVATRLCSLTGSCSWMPTEKPRCWSSGPVRRSE